MFTSKNLLRIILAVWVSIWALFIIRPYLKKDLLTTYREMMPLSLADKHAYVMGRDLYDFLKACEASVPSGSTYIIAGLDKDPIYAERAAYLLYPNTVSNHPEFIFVYNIADYARPGYRAFKRLGADKYLLKKEGADV